MSSQTKFNTVYVLFAQIVSDLFKLFAAAYNWSLICFDYSLIRYESLRSNDLCIIAYPYFCRF
jgi:hypothetical protein